MERSRIPEFYKQPLSERLRILAERGFLNPEDFDALRHDLQVMRPDEADRLVENVIGVFGLPLGLGLNFLVNGKDYVVPLVVEEPSVIAALSSAAKIVRAAGGFRTRCDESLIRGQIQVVDLQHAARAQHAVLQRREEIINLANSLHPRLVARGGGVKDIEAVLWPAGARRREMLVVHLLVDTQDAMGANLVNSMCEGVASLVEKLTNGKVFLRILSNLTDRSVVHAEVLIAPQLLAASPSAGEEVRDGVVVAAEFAATDPYRAATHNKGIMNGIDALALATGNDWRALEAAAHAYAAQGHSYSSLTHWTTDVEGRLSGRLEIPIKVGTVGGSLESNPAVRICHRILGRPNARELAQVMAAVGLAQNFAALRTLVTEGIQQGHMTLHARSVVLAAGAPPESFEVVLERLIESGEIKTWKAREIIADLAKAAPSAPARSPRTHGSSDLAYGSGKVILLGEHAVVYGSRAVAAPIPLAIQAKVDKASDGITVVIPRWGIEERLHAPGTQKDFLHRALDLVLKKLGVREQSMRIEVFPQVPRAMGLGGSAALAVAVIRAVAKHFQIRLSDAETNELAFSCEKLAHERPSGVDNTVATYGQTIIYKRGDPPHMEPLNAPRPIPIVIGLTGVESLTAVTVSKVYRAWERNRVLYDRIFDEIDSLAGQAIDAIKADNLEQLGELMNINQGLLNALQVSSWELEELIQIARGNGALGAKLTGGGGGGAMIALCPDNQERVMHAMQKAGYQAIATEIG
jgi:hydroxymethylglutaryl-CoA reductase